MQTKPILLFNDECGVCRRIARWVQRSAQPETGESNIIERPIGDDPDALRVLNPDLDIWDAYATVHVLMPDGSMKLGGEAVAEVLRSLPNTRWFAWIFAVTIYGVRPFQAILNLAYAVLADARPIFGCESCGRPRVLLRPIHWAVKRVMGISVRGRQPIPTPHFSSLPATHRRPAGRSKDLQQGSQL